MIDLLGVDMKFIVQYSKDLCQHSQISMEFH